MDINNEQYFCYLLIDENRKYSYIGITNNIQRRLRQHNGIISGGAKYTRGKSWNIACFVSNFPDKKAVLQFEWKWKRLTTKNPNKSSLIRRLEGLKKLVNSDKSTNNSTEFNEYSEKLRLNIIDNEILEWIETNKPEFLHLDIL